jgi:hypothetical protein
MTAHTIGREQLLAELVDVSARIDALVIEARNPDSVSETPTNTTELATLRARQRTITEQLEAIQKPGHEKWENIGHGD